MGGFRFNGCGATDHFKKIKSLGTHLCPVCKKETEFFLDEAKFKVDIFFIPTVTLKSRYAVMCGKCGQGEFCSDQWAANLINGAGPMSVIFESQTQPAAPVAVPEPAAPVAVPEPAAPVTVPGPAAYPVPEAAVYAPPAQAARQPVFQSTAAPSFFKCAHCGVTQLREGAFCSFCGKPAPEDPNAPGPGQDGNVPDEMSVCPVCGNRQNAGMKFCSNCGNPMKAQSSPGRVCPTCGAKIEGTVAFCMECGTKL